MARSGRPTVDVCLNDEDRATLQQLATKQSPGHMSLRSQIVLACGTGRSNSDIAAELKVHATTVAKWRHRFAAEGLRGLVDAPRSGPERRIGDDVIESVLLDTLVSAPPRSSHWSTRTLAARHGISHQTVAEIWREFGLKAWRPESSTSRCDASEQQRELVALLLHPPVWAAAFAVDENQDMRVVKGSTPILSPPLTHSNGPKGADTPDNLASFLREMRAALGREVPSSDSNQSMRPFIQFVDEVGNTTPRHFDLHVVLTDASYETGLRRRAWLLHHRPLHLHFTPTPESWLNLVERWCREPTAEWDPPLELARAVRTWSQRRSNTRSPLAWRKSADEMCADTQGRLGANAGHQSIGVGRFADVWTVTTSA